MVRLDCPAVVLVSAPNTGKSLVISATSSGTAEVNINSFTTRGITLGHVRIFCEPEQEVALENVAGVSIPSKMQLIQERLVKGRKDKKKKKNDNDDAMEEKRQLDGEGDEGMGGADAIRINNNDNDTEWGDFGEGMPHCQAASPSS
jgi:hypothetical protein